MLNKQERYTLIHRIINHFKYSVNLFDVLKSYLILRKIKGKRLIVGFYAPFPPFYNGASIFLIKLFEKMIKRKEIQIVALPHKNKINKKLFRFTNFLQSNSKMLDVIISFPSPCESDNFFSNARKISWSTIHFNYGENNDELNSFELLKKSDLILAPTKFTEKQLTLAGLKKINYLPLGVDLSRIKFIKNKEKKVIFVSRSHYYKGLMPFLDSVPFVIKRIPEVQFYLHSPIDKNNPYSDEINNKIKKLKAEYPLNFHFKTKWISFKELTKSFEEAAILVFPSNNEGFGLPLIEAMASGAVCITSDKEPMNELVENNKTGICLPIYKQERYHGFEFPKCEDIAKKTIYLLENEKIRIKLAEKARAKVEREYDLDKVVDTLINIVLGSKR